jgi:hypothetical protein
LPLPMNPIVALVAPSMIVGRRVVLAARKT